MQFCYSGGCQGVAYIMQQGVEVLETAKMGNMGRRSQSTHNDP